MIRRHLKNAFMTTGMVAGVIAWSTPVFAQETLQDTPQQSGASSVGSNSASNPVADNASIPTMAPAPAASELAQPSGTITVTGSRLPPGITSTSPITSVNAKEITKQGYNRIEDVLNRMPQFYGSQNSTVANGSSGTADANLRGLGSQRTLVLINGRRLAPGDPRGQSADLNAIPSSLIKRVDVLTGGASAVYGSDAIAGVVNFIMDTEYEGFHADAQYNVLNNDNNNKTMRRILRNDGYKSPTNTPFDGWGFNANLKFGAGTKDGRGHVVAYLGYRRQAAVTGADRDYTACALNGDGENGAYCGGSSTSEAGTTLLGNSRYHFNNGQLVNGSSLYNYGAPSNIQRPDQRYTAGFFAHYDVTDGFKPYAEFQFMDDRSSAQIAPSGTFGYGRVSCDNPFLTTQEQSILCSTGNTTSSIDSTGKTYNLSKAQFYKRNTEGGSRLETMQHTSYRGVIGSKGEIVKGLTYDLYGQYGSTIYQSRSTNDFSIRKLQNAMNVTTVDGVATCRSVIDGSDSSCVPYDIFSGNGPSKASINYLNTPVLVTGSTQETVVSGSLTFDGSAYGVQLPTASKGLSVNVGAEYRREKMKYFTDEELSSGDLAGTGGSRPSSQGQYDVKELFIEAALPIMDHRRGVNDLTLTGGFRYSDYSSSGSVMSYKGQMVYSPTRGVALRGGYNRAVRAPNISELYSPASVSLDGATDPCAGANPSMTAAQCELMGVTKAQYGNITANPAAQYNGYTGGNPNLKPETANTFTGGISLTPFRRFSFTADFYDIKIKNIVSVLGADNILQLCGSKGLYCDHIHRDENGSLWRSQQGYVTDTNLNIGSLATRGVDFGVNYSYPLGGKYGNLSASFNGTWLLNYKVNPGGGATQYNCAGLYGAVCGMSMPKWRHEMRVSWDLPAGFGFSAMWRFVGGTKSDAGSPQNPDPSATSTFDRKIGNVSYLDLTAYYKVTDKVTLSAGVNNVLGTNPPLITSENGSSNNTWGSVYDVYGRYIFAGLSYDF
ncbi:MAG: TonB-dependent receptor [Zymomonas mobilis]|uniref:TonB-dependent receptor domain-containing protein n=1 Tax=Zymomonas mobilis TaxID=542 RepID=UPI0021C42C88|nr:TonB-dependent receptor [Zymomonas mobilis]MCP9308056.1 TonB-dependent receptor [Zymomonas mobilis]